MKSKLFKKTMALAMAGAMTLSLAACGGGESGRVGATLFQRSDF